MMCVNAETRIVENIHIPIRRKMMRTFARVIVFCAVCVVMWNVSARIRAMATQTQDVPQAGPGGKRFAKSAEIQRALNGETDNQGLRIRGGAYKAEAFDGQAGVTFETQVRESNPGYAYLWVARILSPDGKKEMNRIPYDTEIFTPPVGVVVTPTFSDLIPVPQGESRVMVSLYRFPQARAKEAIATIHATREDAWSYSVLQASAIVNVP
jgi:hypothetical protein